MNIISYVKGLLDKLEGKDANADDYTAVYEKINEINSKNSLPEKPVIETPEKYERLVYDAPTDEQIANTAKDGLAEYKKAGENSVENEIKNLIEKYSADRNANSTNLQKTLKSLSDAYAVAVEEVGADAIKRGLARSSIALNNQTALSEEKARKVSEAELLSAQKDAEIDEKITELEVKRQKALDDFNISYTARLTEEIQKLKDERDKKQVETVKYNNSLSEKERDEEIERKKAESALYESALDQKITENEILENESDYEKDLKYQKIYEVLREKLLSMSAIEAYNQVRNNRIYSQYLSDAYFYKLYDEFGRD